MHEQLPKGYEAKNVEDRWRKKWEEEKIFTPDMERAAKDPENTYSVVIPPPNVTGNLHIGHALNITLQDILCRHQRQLGKSVLWVPGCDHAGIATQNVVERRLAQEGKTRDDLGREAFIDRVWEWKAEYAANITRQIKALGASVDWTRERFTMDDGLSRAVRKVFVDLYHEGLIYKGDYIINWCARCHTALADDEVEHHPRKSHLWKIRYDLEDGSGSLVIATTRPETMLGDTAVAVHPEDERFMQFVGKNVILPLVGRRIPVIADTYVDREFGTGALKVTPSHDHNDWNLGHKHNLEFLSVIDDAGMMNDKAGKYAGMTKDKAREAVVEDLRASGNLVDIEDYEHSVGLCYRCKEVVEPLVSTQWFVKVAPLAEKAKAAMGGDDSSPTRMYPASWLKTYYNWMDNIRDWCISRQIWWGHRIPAWTCDACHELAVAVEAPAVCPKCGGTALHQDEDVLDTWFSSALWPFSTLGWPDDSDDLKLFYPTSVLVTGFDIIFFWVARMMMMGIHFMGEVPFRHTYIHALVRDGEGKKMSKSTGNVIDPLVMIDKYGTDSLRFTLTAFAAMGRDIKLSEDRIEGYRHFVNKIWNAARFALMNLPADGAFLSAKVDLEAVSGTHHQWMLHRLEEMKEQVKKSLAEYRFNDAAQGLYTFIWNEVCDWYLELIKPDMQEGGDKQITAQYVLRTVLCETMLMLHPVMPFVTAEIWAALPGNAGTDIAVQLFPQTRPGCVKPEAAKDMEMIQAAISAVRTIRAELSIAPSLKLTAIIRPADEKSAASLEDHRAMICFLARLETIVVDPAAEAPKASASQVAAGNEIIVPLTGAVDFAAEVARLDKELAKMDKEYAMLSGKLANENYVSRAPADVVERDKARVAELADAKEKLLSLQARFKEAL
ncbi:MAG: Valine--tRNA ligase [Desulfovibrio sp.]